MKIEQIVFDEKNPIICPVCKKILMSDGGDMDMPEACEHVLAWYNDFDQGGWCNIKPYVEKEIRRLCGRRKARFLKVFGGMRDVTETEYKGMRDWLDNFDNFDN